MSQLLVFFIKYLSLFYLDLICFYFLLELFYFNCKLFYFRNTYLKRLSLGAKERRIRADSCQKYEDVIQKYLVQRI